MATERHVRHFFSKSFANTALGLNCIASAPAKVRTLAPLLRFRQELLIAKANEQGVLMGRNGQI